MLVTRRTKDALNILQLLLSDFLKIITFGSLIYLHYFYRKQDQCIIHSYWIHSLNCKLLSEMFQMEFLISNCLYCIYFGNHYFLGTSMVRRSDKSIKILYAFVWLFVLSLSSKIVISAEATTKLCVLQVIYSWSVTLVWLLSMIIFAIIMPIISLVFIRKMIEHIQKTGKKAGIKNKNWKIVGSKMMIIWVGNCLSSLGYVSLFFMQFFNADMSITVPVCLMLYINVITVICNVNVFNRIISKYILARLIHKCSKTVRHQHH